MERCLLRLRPRELVSLARLLVRRPLRLERRRLQRAIVLALLDDGQLISQCWHIWRCIHRCLRIRRMKWCAQILILYTIAATLATVKRLVARCSRVRLISLLHLLSVFGLFQLQFAQNFVEIVRIYS